ncbi:MAG: hypothetical protein KAT69_03270 [Candidatus Aminicenantes bacterium]|nr:hypothetical protein [Candidatus Aminicenantes bacterium]
MKPKVLITRKILPEALDYLKEHVDYEIGEPLVTAERIYSISFFPGSAVRSCSHS